MNQSLEIIKTIVSSAYSKKANRIIVQDLRGISDVCEFQFLCSGESDRQTKAIAQAVEDQCFSSFGIKPVSLEGKQSGHWILLDYGNVLVHVFFSPLRDFYALEQLWPNAKKIDVRITDTPIANNPEVKSEKK